MQTSQFTQMNLSEEMKKAIGDMGFEEATSIQAASIPLILEGRDVIGHSQTGTGKTAAFSIPAIEMLEPGAGKTVQVLVLCPTRELAVQACDEIKKFSKYKPSVKTVPIFGGQPIDRQFSALRGGPQIVVGTPGRVMDHMRRRTLKLDHLRMIILDEADEMLSMGFRDDIETILKDVPAERQTILFSATMGKEIMDITKKYQTNPELIKITREELTVPNIEQLYYEIPVNKKIEVLSRLLDVYNPSRSMVFCNTKRQVDELVSEMQVRGYAAGGLHGDMKQSERTHIMNSFKNRGLDLLVATDVAARGIDVDDIEAVFNYDLPQDVEYYVHRIGRTGRAGKAGRSFTFVSGRRQMMDLRDIMRFTKAKIELRPVPSYDEVMETKSGLFLNSVRKVIDQGGLEKYNALVDSLLEDYSSLDITAALMKMLTENKGKTTLRKSDDALFAAEMGKSMTSRGRDSRPAPRRNGRSGERNTRRPRFSEDNMEHLVINVGKKHRVAPNHILGAIAGETGLPGKTFGRIEIQENSTTVGVPKEHMDTVLKAMKGCKIMGYKTSAHKE